jgi:hypothetical protein
MNLWRKLFDFGKNEEEHDGRDGTNHHPSYRPDDRGHGDEWCGRYPGSVPPMPPDLVCPTCGKSNPPRTRACGQCRTPL